ncbi:carboxypeptidase-like regulatory domain-containing protein [Deinococcus sp. SM5_A1]|uniref:carboxypeptidase-like regulatory domain-containing protein n=1 Tax=Deinococcus sp. SM5_A1 TaxID=3379094 RepID=UPI00385A735F
MKGTVRLLSFLLLSAAAPALAAGPSSTLVPATFNEGAVIVTDRAAVADLASALRDAASAAGSSCTKSEYVVWTQPDDDLETTFNGGIKALGYTYRLLDRSDEAGGRASVFALSGPKQSIAGIWVEAEGNAVLAWCMLKPVAAQPDASSPAKAALQPNPPATSAPKPAPAKPDATTTSPAKPATAPAPARPATPSATAKAPTPKPSYVTGLVLDTQGHPLAGARVFLSGTTFTQGQKTSFETETKADGTYSLRVPDGRYQAKASYTTTFEGQTFSFFLDPASGNPNTNVDSSEGGNLNFRWKLSGLRAGRGAGAKEYDDFYGSGVDFSYCGLPAKAYCAEKYAAVTPGAAPGGSLITVTFTPQGKLVDGSAGKPIVYTFKAAPLAPPGGYPYSDPNGGGRTILGSDWPYHSTDFNDLPLGKYTLTVTATLPSGSTKPLKVGLAENDVEHDSVTVRWVLWDNFNPGSYSGGGIKQMKVYVRD